MKLADPYLSQPSNVIYGQNMEKVPKYTYLILQPGLPGTFGGPFVDEEIEL